MSTEQELVALGSKYLYPNYRQPDLVMCRGEGSVLWDSSGNRYVDLYAGVAVNTLGHAHPGFAEAIAKQAMTLMHVANYYYNAPNVQLAALLCQRAKMDRVLFCNSGAEAVEACLKAAKKHFYLHGDKKRCRIIAFEHAFHGRTLGALAATGTEAYREGYGELPNVTHVPYNDLEAVKAVWSEDVAAIILEPIQGEGGVHPATPEFLRGLRQLCDDTGTLLILDEIQTGVERTGSFLAVHQYGVKPDLVAMAKGLGGGFPIGAMLSTEALSGALPPGSHGTTFGGNALASQAALYILQQIEAEDIPAQVEASTEILTTGLDQLIKKYPHILLAQRGMGLLRAIDLAEAYPARELIGKFRSQGVLVILAGGNAIRFAPALNITAQELTEGLDHIDQVLAKLP